MDFSAITDDLFIGTTPSVSDYDHLRELGVRLAINMRVEKIIPFIFSQRISRLPNP
jgi:protein tyrosine phosphatase (PTP) superfamily phosphohydrolase (DUF442 family)